MRLQDVSRGCVSCARGSGYVGSVYCPQSPPGSHLARIRSRVAMEKLRTESDQWYRWNSNVLLSEDELDCKKEELESRYFRAVEVTNRTLLETLVTMLFLTCTKQGYKSVRDYCERHIRWKQPDIKLLFTHDERKLLKENPTKEPYSAMLNMKLLTKVWTGLGVDVAEKVRDLERLTLEAIHDPPQFSGKVHLWKQLQNLYFKQKQVSKCVLKLCHSILKEMLLSLIKKQMVLKRKIGLVFRKILLAEKFFCSLPIERAVANMEFTYQLLMIDEGMVPDVSGSISLSHLNKTLSALEEPLHNLVERQETYMRKLFRLNPKIEGIKKLYMELIKICSLYDIISEINEIGGSEVCSGDLLAWHRTLKDLREDRTGRLRALGRCEILSCSAGCGARLSDISRWLMTRKAATFNVKKFYSLIKISDATDVITVDQLLQGQVPQVTVLSGPVGSGKTAFCQYLFDKWHTGCSSIKYITNLELLICLSEENVESNSFVHYLKTNLFQRSLGGLEDAEVLSTLRQLRVLFIVDALSRTTKKITDAVKELVKNLGTNSIFITTQRENKRKILQVLWELNVKAFEVHLLPLTKSQSTDLCLDFMKVSYPTGSSTAEDLVHPSVYLERDLRTQHRISDLPVQAFIQDKVQLQTCRFAHSTQYPGSAGLWSYHVEDIVRKFIEKLMSEEREDELMYPLPLAYMFTLWLEDPRRLNQMSTVSRLFEEVISFCHLKLSVKLQDSCRTRKKNIGRKSSEEMEELFEMASQIFNGYHRGNALSLDDVDCDSLYPFLVCCSKRLGRQTNHEHKFLHPSLIQVLHARGSVITLINKNYNWLQLFKPNLPDILPLTLIHNTGSKYLNVIKYLCGYLSINQALRARTATHIIKLFKCVGVCERDYPTWASLLCEGGWSPPLKKAVSSVLACSLTWKAPEKSCQETRAVSRLVTRGVYKLHEVIITSEAPEEVVGMLISRPSIDVRILPAHGFQGVSEGQRQDSLMKALVPAGCVTELWGSLGVDGADSLAFMPRLQTMYIHLNSLSAVRAFCKSIGSCSALRYLHLHLDLPATTPAETLPSLYCPAPVTVCLILSNIVDDSWVWAVAVTKQLGCHYQEVQLTHTHLSPSKLHALKQELHPTPVHASH